MLRRKLESLEGEYESKVSELQTDVAELRRSLDEQTNGVRLAERQKSSIISQLTEQNQRLSAQLKEVNFNLTFCFVRTCSEITRVTIRERAYKSSLCELRAR